MTKLVDNTFTTLSKAITKVFGQTQTPYEVYYREEDGDFILIENDDDLELCIEEAKENKQKPKFYLVEPGSDPLEALENPETSKTFIENLPNESIGNSQKTEQIAYPSILEPEIIVEEEEKKENLKLEINFETKEVSEDKLESRAFNEAHVGVKCDKCKVEPIIGGRYIVINKDQEQMKVSYCQKCADEFSDDTLVLKLASPVPNFNCEQTTPPSLNVNVNDEEKKEIEKNEKKEILENKPNPFSIPQKPQNQDQEQQQDQDTFSQTMGSFNNFFAGKFDKLTNIFSKKPENNPSPGVTLFNGPGVEVGSKDTFTHQQQQPQQHDNQPNNNSFNFQNRPPQQPNNNSFNFSNQTPQHPNNINNNGFFNGFTGLGPFPAPPCPPRPPIPFGFNQGPPPPPHHPSYNINYQQYQGPMPPMPPMPQMPPLPNMPPMPSFPNYNRARPSFGTPNTPFNPTNPQNPQDKMNEQIVSRLIGQGLAHKAYYSSKNIESYHRENYDVVKNLVDMVLPIIPDNVDKKEVIAFIIRDFENYRQDHNLMMNNITDKFLGN